MGYDLVVYNTTNNIYNKNTSSYKIANEIKKMFSENPEGKYYFVSVAIDCMYIDYDGNPVGSGKKDCRGCYLEYVIEAYILVCIFVWHAHGCRHNMTMITSGDDGCCMVKVRFYDDNINVQILQYDVDLIEIVIPNKYYGDSIGKIIKNADELIVEPFTVMTDEEIDFDVNVDKIDFGTLYDLLEYIDEQIEKK